MPISPIGREVPDPAAPKQDPIVVHLVKVGVNMGDHGETVVEAYDIPDTMTIREVMEALQPPGSTWVPRDYSHRVELRFAKPLPTPDPLDKALNEVVV